jgi:NAD(P)H-nitrite reductase large subunit
MAEAVKERYAKVVETNKDKDKSVEAGREFVEAYVKYMHYVEGIHAAIVSTGAHHADAGTPAHKD